MSGRLPADVLAALQGCVDEIQYLRSRAKFPAGHWLKLNQVQENACKILNENFVPPVRAEDTVAGDGAPPDPVHDTLRDLESER